MEYFVLQAVKQDIVRSLASRLELHWDSLIQEEHESPEGVLTLCIIQSNTVSYRKHKELERGIIYPLLDVKTM